MWLLDFSWQLWHCWELSIYLVLFGCRWLLPPTTPLPAGRITLPGFKGICMGSDQSEILLAIRDLQDQIRELTIAVHRLAEAPPTHHGSPLRVAIAGPSVSVEGSPYRSAGSVTSSTSADYNLLASSIPPIPDFVRNLALSLRRGPADSLDRATRAWQIGYWARFVLSGRVRTPRPSPPIDLPNTVYVVLRAPGFSTPLVCTRGCDYRHVVGNFDRDTLSHGFPSIAEAKIYCAGADVTYPTAVYQWRP